MQSSGWDFSGETGIQDPRKSLLEHLYLTFSLDLLSNIPVNKNKFVYKDNILSVFENIHFSTNFVIIILFHQCDFRRNIRHVL